MRAEILKGHLDGLILAALEDGPLHGYAVLEALRSGSGGAFDLPTGTIYPALHRLERAGLVAGTWSRAAGRQRRSYRLTAAGRTALKQQRANWREFSAAMSAIMEREQSWPAGA
jgi:DNA-binding PadR family transcriptional regulator